MNLKVLVPLAWTFWTILLGVAFYGLIMVSQDTQHSPEAGPGLGYFAVAFVFIVLIAAGGIVYVFAKKQSRSGVMAMAASSGS